MSISLACDERAVITPDGRRYEYKPPMQEPPIAPNGRRSCFLCGQFRLPAQMRTVRVLAKNHVVCAPQCAS